MPQSLKLPSSAGGTLTPLEKRVVLHAWLSACILAVTSSSTAPGQTFQVLEGLPPPLWVIDSRSPEGKQLTSVLSLVLLAPAGESLQRLMEFAVGFTNLQGNREERGYGALVGVLFSVALRRRVRHTGWSEAGDVEDLIADASNVLEAIAPSAAAALQNFAKAAADAYCYSAEPLVQWLCSRRSSRPNTDTAPPAVSSEEGEASTQDETAEARQVHSQGVQLENRLTATFFETNSALKDDAALWLTDLASLLVTLPMQQISTQRYAGVAPSFVSKRAESHPRHNLFDFIFIADHAVQQAKVLASIAAASLQEEEVADSDAPTTPPTQGLSQPALTKLRTRGITLFAPTGDGPAAVKGMARPEKSGEGETAEAEGLGASSICNALVLLFQRGAAAASRAVAVGAPMLAYSIIVQLGNALLLLNPDVDFFAIGSQAFPEPYAKETFAFPDATRVNGLMASGETLTSNAREENKTGDCKTGKRADPKGAGRSTGVMGSNLPNLRGGKIHEPLERRPLVALWVAAGVVAQACVEVPVLLLREYWRATDKNALNAAVTEGW